MTRKEAIERLDLCQNVCNDCLTCASHDEALDMTIAALREQPRWISVEERLPKRFSRVLVWGEEEGAVGEAEYDGENFKWVEDENLAFATHWMPLPEPPEEEV